MSERVHRRSMLIFFSCGDSSSAVPLSNLRAISLLQRRNPQTSSANGRSTKLVVQIPTVMAVGTEVAGAQD